MGSNSTHSSKRKPQTTRTGRTKGTERGPRAASDSERGMASPNQKRGASRRSPQGGRQG